MASPALGVALALASAAVWGSGDFTGGYAARRTHSLQVLVLAALSGMAVLLLLAVLWREPLPSASNVVWAALAGSVGSVGIFALYRGLAVGNAAAVAPTSAVIGAAVPVIFTLIVEGTPRPLQLGGFIAALGGIWLVAAARPAAGGAQAGIGWAIVAGLGFGGFFVLIGQVADGLVFGPLVVARAMGVLGGVALLRAGSVGMPRLTAEPLAMVAGVLDAGGNVLYVLAQQQTRLDVAAVLSSFYPVTTVLLAWAVAKEHVTPRQWLGAALCLAATSLIAA